MKENKMISPQEFAQEIGRPYDTVMRWLRGSLVPGVEVIQESRGPVYKVPATAIPAFRNFEPKRGRPRKPLEELKSKPRRKD
jgi:hypothetical protein